LDITQLSKPALANCSIALVETVNQDLELLVSDSVSYQVVRAFSTVLAKGKSLPKYILKSITTALKRIMNEVQNSMAEDEVPRGWLTTNIRLLASVVNSEAITTSDFYPPQFSVESSKHIPKPVVTVNSSGVPSDASSVGVKILQYNTNPRNFTSKAEVVFAQATIYGDEVSLIRRKLSNDGRIGVEVTLLNHAPIDYNETVIGDKGSVSCRLNDIPYLVNVTCAENQIFSVQCDGTEYQEISYGCPDLLLRPECTIWNGVAHEATKNCHVVAYSNLNTTCHCYSTLTSTVTKAAFVNKLLYHDLSHRKLVNEVSQGDLIEFGTVVALAANNFGSTVSSIASLSPRDIRRNLVIVLTMSVVLFLTLVGMFFFVRMDKAIFEPEKRNRYLKKTKKSSHQFNHFLKNIRPVEFVRSPWYAR
jgi:hypothetical protein